MRGLLTQIGYLGYFVLGLFYMVAISAGIQVWFRIELIFAFIIGFFVAQMPLVGTVAAVMGAMKAWNWTLLYSLAVFVAAPLIVATIFGSFLGLFRS